MTAAGEGLRVHTSSPSLRDAPLSTSSSSSSQMPRIGRWIPPPANKDGKLRLHIDGYWYDLTKWKHQHPGGSAILEHLNGKDATDAFYSLHSKEALARLQRMHRVAAEPNELQIPAECTAFRKFRQQLVDEGWFERSVGWEAFYMLSVYVLATIGTYLGTTGHPWWAILFIGLAMQQAGWIGHDYIHGRGDFATFMGRSFGGLVNAFSPSWWSEKHNTHHVYTNYLGVDTDVDNDPVFHLFFPDENNDPAYRAYQHLYFIPAVSALYVSWRIQSFQHALRTRNYFELSTMVINYSWLIYLPWYVSVGSIILAGFLVGIIVTATHQSEEMIHADDQISKEYNYVRTQFDTTRDAECGTFLMEWLWGGMQYQLEHHLFPTMPKYRYAALVPRLKAFAAENGMDYRVDTVWTILARNVQTLKYYAARLDDVMATSPANSPKLDK